MVQIVDAGADHCAEAAAFKQEPECRGECERYANHEQAIDRKRQIRDAERARQFARHRHRARIAGPDPDAGIGNDEGDAQRHQHLRQRLAGQPAQDEALDQRSPRMQIAPPPIRIATQKFTPASMADSPT